MITLKDYLEAIEYRITGGSDYHWDCFGPNARYLDCDTHESGENTYSINACFDSIDQTVYALEFWDYVNDREYRWINPDFKSKYKKESVAKEIDFEESMDGRKWIDLDLAEDILEKMNAMVNGNEYDTRVKVPVDFSDEDLLQYMKLAHELDITFNELVERAIKEAIEQHEFHKDWK